MEVVREGGGGGVVEDEGRRQAGAGGGVEAVAELDGGEGVEAEVGEGAVGLDGVGAAEAEDGGGFGPYEGEQEARPFGLAEGGQPLYEPCGPFGTGRARGAPCRADEGAQQWGQYVGEAGEGLDVQVDRDGGGRGCAECLVEEREPVFGGEGAQSGALDAVAVRVAELGEHAARGDLCPGAPGQRVGGEAAGAALRGEAVEQGVGGRVVGLARRAEDSGDRGVQHEQGEVEVRGELVQVQRGIGLGREDALEAVGRHGLDDAVVEDAGGVDDAGEGAVGGDGVEYGGQRRPVGDVAGCHGDLRAHLP